MPRVSHASATREGRDPDVQVGKEGKGKERKGKEEGSAEGSGRFQKPTLSELQSYFAEISLSESPQKFLDYYTANGWKVGRNPMRDWRATARNWKTKRAEDQPKPKYQPLTAEELEMIQR
jgi:hypothetical protein